VIQRIINPDPYVAARVMFLYTTVHATTVAGQQRPQSANSKMASQPPDFEQDDEFPLQWCNATGKLYCDKANRNKFPRLCPLCNCFTYESYRTWQQHVINDHNCTVTTVYMEEQKKKRRATVISNYMAKKRAEYTKKKRREPALQKIKIAVLRDNGDFESTNRGFHTKAKSRESLVTVGPSKIQDAGRGVFANADLVKKQVVTRYDGEIHHHESIDNHVRQHTIKVEQKKKKGNDTSSYLYLWGLTNPMVGRGLGSFLNRPKRGQRANCIFEVDDDRKTVWVKALKNIKTGTELVASYGHGFRIPKAM
jgi:SET domain